ncbi:putative phospholipid-transporting ATPase VB [Bagarius yarrelli]|uniref:Phospholipid-transporting ATPase n=1 Tax=Bagarius yarrelli TaxID=175774 RepID=A0A556V9W3_BAGYA|nr:putative phospholipid-transporting ATPase VB [Bagarius yarrelli]
MTWISSLASVWSYWTRQGDGDSTVRTLVPNLLYNNPKSKDHPNRNYVGNGVKTTKYTIWSFIPVNLMEQLRRVANIYFIGLAVLNFVPAVNAFQPQVAIIPICVILAFTAIKDAWEDFRRYQSDRQLNSRPCLVYSRSQQSFVQKRWKDIRVGDFVQVLSNEIVPADILLLHTSNPNGVCHMETANLDGETNLKQRKVVPGFSATNTRFEPLNFNSTVVCEKPNKNLNSFNGFLEQGNEKMGFDIESLMLRGCTVRNTDHASGIVVYAGHECKSMLNNGKPRSKCSKLERKMNKDVLFCVLLLFCMCLIGAIGHICWLKNFPSIPLYFIPESNGTFIQPFRAGIYMFLTMIILLQVLIPISLYLSIELVKIGQVFFITQDLDLYDEEKDSRVQCRALNITEDLGQIQYIFSDKTGTLTENKMVFRRCTIIGTEFPHEDNATRLAILAGETDQDEEVIYQQNRQSSLFSLEAIQDVPAGGRVNSSICARSRFNWPKVIAGTPGRFAFSSPLETEVLPDQTLLQLVEDAECGRKNEHYLEFFLALAICNTVVVSTKAAQRQRTKVKHSTSYTQSHDCMEGLLSRVASFGKLIKGRRRTFSDPFHIDRMGSPNIDVPSFFGSMESPNESRSIWGQDQTGSSLSVIEDVCYEAQSPDEAALVHAAKAYGFILKERTPHHVTVQLPRGKLLRFDMLDVLAFDPTRRRMSVIVRHPETKKIVMYTKGADSCIMERVQKPSKDKSHLKSESGNIVYKTQSDLDMYARDGLRTLCFTRKVLSEQDYRNWSGMRQRAMTAIEKKEELLMDTAAFMESNLKLLGATGIEDRLQENVPETIQALREAGIKVWVLTGDKLETAVNIAYSCKLLDQNDLVFTFKMANKDVCRNMLNGALGEIPQLASEIPRIGLVIDGQTLGLLLDKDLQVQFLQLCRYSRCVLCCRVTPLQKSEVVTLLRDRLKVMTLAIGDGANDVNMIQAADVGVGISGQEGMQAYVNLLFWYQFLCGFSGTAMIDYWFMIFFNLFFTSTPPIMFGIMDREVSAHMLLNLPELYKKGQHAGTYQGSDVGIFSLGTPMNTVSLFTILFHLAIEIKSWTVVHWVIMIGSVLTFFIVTLAFSALCISCNPPSDPYWIMQQQMKDPLFLPGLHFNHSCSTTAKARQIDQLPPDRRDMWLREWRSLKDLCNSYPSLSSSTRKRSSVATVHDGA